MASVLIVDDNRIVREYMRRIIEATGGEFTLAGEAGNGKKGLELSRALRPDLIVLDVEMPLMSGVEFLERLPVGEAGSVLVLSCHEEYEFVRDAMKLGAGDYLIKQRIDDDSLIGALRKLRDARAKSAEQDGQALAALLSGKRGAPDALLGGARWFALLAVSVDGEPMARMRSGAGAVERMERALWDALRAEVGGTVGAVCRIHAGLYAALAAFSGDMPSEARARRALRERAGAIRAAVYVSVSVGVSAPGRASDNPAQLWKQARAMIDQRFVLGPGLLHLHPAEARDCPPDAFDDAIARLKELGSPREDLMRCAGELFDIARRRGASPDAFHLAAQALSYLPVQLCAFLGLEAAQVFDGVDVMREAGAALETLSGFERWFEGAMDTVYARQGGANMRSEIQKALRYIHEHYAQDITLDAVARHVNVSKAYFSTIFKRETGQNYGKYLLDLRLQRACELLAGSDKMICDIAQLAGFGSHNYFNNIFKACYGVTPKRYRDQLGAARK